MLLIEYLTTREIIIDTETTGLDPLSGHRVVEIGAVEMVDRCRGARFDCRVLGRQAAI
jgi:DNA polymerase III epsilon subunit-like protein